MKSKDKEKVLRKIREIVKKASDGEYVYRGQSDAAHPHVTSTLYREMVKGCPEIIGANMNSIQEEALTVARKYTSEDYNDKEMLSRIQHYSGDSNLIDFTRDCYVALFFACSHKGGEDGGKDGEVFLLKTAKLKKKDSEFEMVTSVHPSNRVIVQKSVFIQSRRGFILRGEMEVVKIPRGLKQDVLIYLKEYHGISEYAIYNDLHGYIRNRKAHHDAVIKFYRGLIYGHKSDSIKTQKRKNNALKKAIKYFDEAIQLAPDYAKAYYNRGLANLKLGDMSSAIKHYKDVISDCDKAIALDPDNVDTYNNRGLAKGKLGDVRGAVRDYDNVIKVDLNYAPAYYNRGLAKEVLGDMQNFEQALSDFKNAKKLALQKNRQNVVDLAQESIERVKVKISKL